MKRLFFLFLVFTSPSLLLAQYGTNTVQIAQDSTGWTRVGTNVYLTTTTNNIGIGTVSPTKKLSISNGTDTYSFDVVSNRFTFYNDLSTPSALAYLDSSGQWSMGTTPTSGTRLRLKSTGLGTTPFSIESGNNTNTLFSVQQGGGGNPLLVLSDNNGVTKVQFHASAASYVSGGSLTIGGTTIGTAATAALGLVNGTKPSAVLANGVMLYAQDSTGVSQLYVLDEGNQETKLSPHDPKTGEWIFYSKNIKTGKIIKVDMERFFRYFDKKFDTDFFHEIVKP